MRSSMLLLYDPVMDHIHAALICRRTTADDDKLIESSYNFNWLMSIAMLPSMVVFSACA